MPIKRLRVLPGMLALIALAACAENTANHLTTTTPAFGEAVRETLAAQVIDPTPHYTSDNPVTNGEQSAQALQRFSSGNVKQPERLGTARGGSGGGGGGASVSSGSGN